MSNYFEFDVDKVKSYMRDSGITFRDIANELEVDHETVVRVLDGEIYPPEGFIGGISVFTGIPYPSLLRPAKPTGEINKNKKHPYQEWIDYMRMAGESIAKNAESIVGDEELLRSVSVSIWLSPGEAPEIDISRQFLPEGIKGHKGPA